jgi:hypothetical protein
MVYPLHAMLDPQTKKESILPDKFCWESADPKAQVEQITTALIYKFMMTWTVRM